MVKALVVCNPKSGRGRAIKHANLIKKELIDYYDVTIFISDTLEMLEKTLTEEIKKYEVLLICGGDGTFHKCINILSNTIYRPLIGYIPEGTACDTGKNLMMSKKLKKSLDIIKKGQTMEMSMMKANDIYVCYAMATGKYVSTSYLTNSKLKFFGPIGYLFIGLLEMVLDYNMKAYVNDFVSPTKYNTKVVCILNTKSIGSVTLKEKEKKIVLIHHGVVFNLARIALKRYILSKQDVTVLPLDKEYIINVGKQTWSIDGEKVVFEGDIKITNDAVKYNVICGK